jgi:acyl-coenzyme A synthetase/AMP-(fatty) acid ligase
VQDASREPDDRTPWDGTEWYFVPAFPQTPSGKIQKFLLREQIAGRQLTPS